MIALAIQLFFLLGFMIACHEMGHYLYFRLMLSRRIRIYLKRRNLFLDIEAGRLRDYTRLTDWQYIEVNAWGVVLGAFPLLACLMLGAEPFYLWMLMPYGVGCRKDINEIIKTIWY